MITFFFDFLFEVGMALSGASKRRDVYWFLGLAAAVLLLALVLNFALPR